MSTQRINIDPSDGWVKVADAADEEFLIENGSASGTVFLKFNDGAPTDDDQHHYLRGREAIVRVASGDVYVKAEAEGSSVIVSI